MGDSPGEQRHPGELVGFFPQELSLLISRIVDLYMQEIVGDWRLA